MTEQRQPPINTIAAYAMAILGIVICLFTVVGSLANFGKTSDLPQYYTAAQMLVQGKGPQIYNITALFAQEHLLFPSLSRGIGVFLPPFSIPLLLPLVLVPVPAAPVVWTVVLCFAFAFALFLIARAERLDRQQVLWLVGVAFLSGPAVEALRIGQLAPLMLLALVLFARFADKKTPAAAIALSILIFKPQQLFPVLLFTLASNHKRLFGYSIAVLAVLYLLGHIIFGNAGLGAYVAAVTDPANLELMQPEINPTFRGQLLRVMGMQSRVPSIVGAIALLCSAAAIGLLAWRNRKNVNWMVVALTCALPIGLCTSLHCHDYDLLLLIPGMVALVRSQYWQQLPGLAKGAFMLGVGAFLLPFYNDIHYGYLLKGGLLNAHFFLLLGYACWMLYAGFTAADKLERADAPAVNGDSAS